MNKTIAVMHSGEEGLSDFYHAQEIRIYEKTDNWHILESIPFEGNVSGGLIQVRERVGEFKSKIDPTKIILSKEFIGLPFHILSNENYVICEAEEVNDLVLDQIYEDYCVEKEKVPESPESVGVPKKPYPLDEEGNFFFDFELAQRHFPELTSKKALLPFFSQELFQSLTLVCSHIMPWLETFLDDRRLEIASKREDGKYILLISHKYCGEE